MTDLTYVLQTPEANWVTSHNNPVTPARTIKKGPCASWIFHQVWHIEIWKVAGVVLVGKASDIRTQAWTHADTHTQLGQHRWVVGKQAAAGGRMGHKARRLAKFHHLLWIAWEARSTASRAVLLKHMQLQINAQHQDAGNWYSAWVGLCRIKQK